MYVVIVDTRQCVVISITMSTNLKVFNIQEHFQLILHIARSASSNTFIVTLSLKTSMPNTLLTISSVHRYRTVRRSSCRAASDIPPLHIFLDFPHAKCQQHDYLQHRFFLECWLFWFCSLYAESFIVEYLLLFDPILHRFYNFSYRTYIDVLGYQKDKIRFLILEKCV